MVFHAKTRLMPPNSQTRMEYGDHFTIFSVVEQDQLDQRDCYICRIDLSGHKKGQAPGDIILSEQPVLCDFLFNMYSFL